jgi:hypothetical protein
VFLETGRPLFPPIDALARVELSRNATNGASRARFLDWKPRGEPASHANTNERAEKQGIVNHNRSETKLMELVARSAAIVDGE